MAKAKKKSAKEASNIFHNIMQASVGLDKGQVLKIEQYLKSDMTEMNNTGSALSANLSPQQRKDMLNRLLLLKPNGFVILKNQIVRK